MGGCGPFLYFNPFGSTTRAPFPFPPSQSATCQLSRNVFQVLARTQQTDQTDRTDQRGVDEGPRVEGHGRAEALVEAWLGSPTRHRRLLIRSGVMAVQKANRRRASDQQMQPKLGNWGLQTERGASPCFHVPPDGPMAPVQALPILAHPSFASSQKCPRRIEDSPVKVINSLV